MKLSVVIPSYNEERTLPEVVARVRAVVFPGWEREIVVVDDDSTDGTGKAIAALEGPDLIASIDRRNRGKGAAVRRGIRAATGDVVVVQDADLEYDPRDLPALLERLIAGEADAVYGSRILGRNRRSYFSYYWGGRLLTLIFNLLYGQRLTDLTTCYKMLRRDRALELGLECDGFEFCEEVSARLVRQGGRIADVPIRYLPRSIGEGKKIRWHDGLTAVWTLLRLRLVPVRRRTAPSRGA